MTEKESQIIDILGSIIHSLQTKIEYCDIKTRTLKCGSVVFWPEIDPEIDEGNNHEATMETLQNLYSEISAL